MDPRSPQRRRRRRWWRRRRPRSPRGALLHALAQRRASRRGGGPRGAARARRQRQRRPQKVGGGKKTQTSQPKSHRHESAKSNHVHVRRHVVRGRLSACVCVCMRMRVVVGVSICRGDWYFCFRYRLSKRLLSGKGGAHWMMEGFSRLLARFLARFSFFLLLASSLRYWVEATMPIELIMNCVLISFFEWN